MTALMRQWTIDAFAERPFRGNPACVVEPFTAWPDPVWMQALAQENNQAETAFLLRTEDPARFGLRWFTPAVEVKLCGHATLASAHAITVELGEGAELLTFDTLSGALTVSRDGDGYRMNFPADPPRRIEEPTGLAAALGVEPVECWTAQYLIAVLESESTVRALKPDIPALCGVDGAAGWGPGHLIVAAGADEASPYQVVSRFFGPGSGISEDPTTGSAHCLLAPLFIEKLGRPKLAFHQAYPGRGGDLVCELDGDRVLIGGRAVTVLDGKLRT